MISLSFSHEELVVLSDVLRRTQDARAVVELGLQPFTSALEKIDAAKMATRPGQQEELTRPQDAEIRARAAESKQRMQRQLDAVSSGTADENELAALRERLAKLEAERFGADPA